MTAWLAWSALVSLLVAIAAAAGDRVAGLLGAPRRFVWIIATIAAASSPALMLQRPAPVIEAPYVSTVVHGPVLTTLQPDLPPGFTSIAETPSRTIDVARAVVRRADPWILPAWLLASFTYLVLLVRAVWRLRRRRSLWIETDSELGHVFVAPDTGPAVVGVFRPRIVLPAWTLDADRATRSLVLRHELEHLRAGDSRVLFGAAVLRMLFPWNAALFWMTRQLRLAIEIDCDTRVIRAVGGAHRYGVVLLAVGERYAAELPNSAFLSEPGTFLEARINAMTTPRRRRPFAASIPFVGLVLLALTTAASTPRPTPLLPLQVVAPRVPATPAAPVVVRDTTPVRPIVTVPAAKAVRPVETPAIVSPALAPLVEIRTPETPVVIRVDPKPLRGNSAPRYPDDLKDAGMEGVVLLKIRTDARGVPDTATLQVVESTHASFTSSVRSVLPAWRFDSAGLVRMAFRFAFSGTLSSETTTPSFVIDGVSIPMPVVITAARPSASSQEVAIPNTPAGRAFKSWLEALNSGDHALIVAYNEKYTPVAARQGMIKVHDNIGPVDLLAVRNSEPTSLEFVLRERRTGDTDVGLIALSEGEEPRVKSLRFLLVNNGRTPDDPGLLAQLRSMRP